jgi:hypothetical protein
MIRRPTPQLTDAAQTYLNVENKELFYLLFQAILPRVDHHR